MQQWEEIRDLYHAHFKEIAYLLMILGVICIIASAALFTHIPSAWAHANWQIDQVTDFNLKKKEDLIKTIIELEKENESLNRAITKYKTTKAVGLTFIFLGGLFLLLTIFYPSIIPALTGLGLIFWGGVLLYVRPTKYVRYGLLRESNIFVCKLIDKILKNFDHKGKWIYLSSKTLKGLTDSVVFIPKKKKIVIPSEREFSENKLFSKNPEGMYLPSPGSNLVKLFREWLGKDPSGLTLSELADKITIFLVENLEIVKDVQIDFEDDKVYVKFSDPTYMELCEEIRENFQTCFETGCPFCSFIACLLTKVTNNASLINKISCGKKEIEACYQIIKQ